MATILSINGDNVDKENLLERVAVHRGEEEMRELFLNMDIAMKYIHERGYYIVYSDYDDDFVPTDIEILNDKPDHIQFKTIKQMPDDIDAQDAVKRKNVFRSSWIQISLYTDTVAPLLEKGENSTVVQSQNAQFLKDHFDMFETLLPVEDVPYYRGVIQRGAKTYYSDYTAERAKRDLVQLEKQLGELDGKNPFTKVSNQNVSAKNNNQINARLYPQISGYREAAFVNCLIIPIIIIVCLAVLWLVFGFFW